MGKRREKLAADLRGLPHGHYMIYYLANLATNATLTIVRVLHDARDAAAIFGDGE